MEGRINVVVNGKRDLAKVVRNLKPLFESGDRVLLYTASGEETAKRTIASELVMSTETVADNMAFAKFNEYGKLGLNMETAPRFIVLAMPNGLFRKMPCAFNAALKFVDDTSIARFVHFFCDDLKFYDATKYDPRRYEWYMDTFKCPFLTDPKTSRTNYAFKKLSPRFILVSKRLPFPISFYHYEGREHFVVDRDAVKENFDENVNRMFVAEFVARLREKGLVRHMTFYPDPFLETIFMRDGEIDHTPIDEAVRKQYMDDDGYIYGTLKRRVVVEAAIDPLIAEHGSVIDAIDCAADYFKKDIEDAK